MTEKAPTNGERDGQELLFGMGQGAYGDSVRYLDPGYSDAQFTSPEKPKPLLEMTSQEMILVAAQDRIIPDIYGHFDEKRGDFIKQHPWSPYSEGEATRAIGGGLVNYLLGAKNKSGLAAVRDVLADVDRDRARAFDAVDTLRLVQDTETGQFNPEWARGNTHVKQILARAIFARNSLNLFEWPRHYDRRKKETKANKKVDALLMSLTQELSVLDDETMEHLLTKTLIHEQERLRFWSDQLEKSGADNRTSDLIAAAKSSV
jgi:hypothetical protein